MVSSMTRSALSIAQGTAIVQFGGSCSEPRGGSEVAGPVQSTPTLPHATKNLLSVWMHLLKVTKQPT